jgi:hypothetical protein
MPAGRHPLEPGPGPFSRRAGEGPERVAGPICLEAGARGLRLIPP